MAEKNKYCEEIECGGSRRDNSYKSCKKNAEFIPAIRAMKNVIDIAETFGVKIVDITWGITLVLMLGSNGVIIFGFADPKHEKEFLLIVSYQTGALASSASFTTGAELDARFPVQVLGSTIYDQRRCIFMCTIACCVLVALFLGPENFHQFIKTDFILLNQDAFGNVDIQLCIYTVSTFDQEAKLRGQKLYEDHHGKTTVNVSK